MVMIYSAKQNVSFNQRVLNDHPSKLVSQGLFSFPSNVINCSLSIVHNTSSYDYSNNAHDNALGYINFLGAGVGDISYVGTQVMFTAWMYISGVKDKGATGPYSNLQPDLSYLTVLAIAECE